MIAYAETNACRRRAILDYFGDPDSANAPLCCDNCLTRADVQDQPATPRDVASLSQTERAALIVLDALAHLQWDVGKGKLAKLLKGSATKGMAPYTNAKYFGKFAALRLSEIESIIGQLIDSGHIKQVGSRLPTLKLTPRGEAALESRAAIQVSLRPILPGAVQRLAAQKEAGSTVTLSGQLLTRGLTPEQIAAERGLTLGTVYSHLARLITDRQVSINAVVPAEAQQQVRAVIESIGSVERLSEIKMRLPESIDYGVIRCVVNAWLLERGDTSDNSAPMPVAGTTRSYDYSMSIPETKWSGTTRLPDNSTTRPSDEISAFLSRPHPRPLNGPWLAGWALDFNSRFSGADHSRSEIGELVYAYKYRGERRLAHDLASRWAELLANHPELPKPDAVIPIPPSTRRDFDPVTLLAQSLAGQLSIPALTDTLVKTRATKPQKEMTALAQKQANVAGAFALKSGVRGKQILLVDDLYDSGVTLAEAARVLARGGAASVVVLTLTKTIHADQ